MKNNMITGFKKLVFIWKKPKIVLILCSNEEHVAEEHIASVVFNVMNKHLKTKMIEGDVSAFDFFRNKVLIFKAEPDKRKMLEFLLNKSNLPILALCGMEEDFSINEYIVKLVESLGEGFLILNSDNKYLLKIGKDIKSKVFSLGFQNKADFCLTDIKVNGDTNFKISYRGNIVPFWLSGIANKEKIYSALVAASIGELIGLNLVKISKTLKEV